MGRAPRWLTADEQDVWQAYLEVSRLLFDRLGRQLAEDSGLSLPEYEILVQLSDVPHRQLRMSELADRAVNSRSRLTHSVRRLEERGWVRREASADDGRGVVCVLTDQGFAVLAEAAPGHVEMVRNIVFDPLCAADVVSLGASLRKIRAVLRDGAG